MAKLTSFLLLSLFVSSAFSLGATPIRADNEWYNVFVDPDYGIWTASTGVNHPGGANKDILYGGNEEMPFTVYVSVHSYTSGKTYHNSELLSYVGTANDILFNPVEDSGNDATSIWVLLSTPDDAPDSFTVKITWNVDGTQFSNAAIRFTTDVTNTGSSTVKLGVRWQMDYQIAGDDGCSFATYEPNSGRYIFEHEWKDPQFEQYLISPNQIGSTQFYEAYGPVTGPTDYVQNPTVVDKIQFTSWSQNTEVSYQTGVDTSDQVVHTDLQDDSTVMLYWYPKNVAAGNTWNIRSGISIVIVETGPNGVIVCDDNWPCTYDHIDMKAGHVQQCIHIPQEWYCDDFNPCTVDSCDPYNYPNYLDEASGCVHLDKDCGDGLFCTEDICTEEGECIHVDMSCDDHVDCTVDECNEHLGGCISTPSDEACEPEGGDLCNTWWCEPYQGCVAEPVECDDQIACTDNMCGQEGCYFVENDDKCNDDVDCTVHECNAALGKCTIYADDQRCDDGDPCTIDYCDIVKGCQAIPVLCDGNDTACVVPQCIDGFCIGFAEDFRCTDDNYCTDEYCHPSLGCKSIPNDNNCNDDNFCSVDWCDPILGCSHAPYECDDHLYCTEDHCSYEDQECVFEAVDARCDEDGVSCTVDWCDKTKGCQRVFDNELCEDGNPCTFDYCWGASADSDDGCVHIEEACDDDIACTLDECVDGQCQYHARNSECVDNIECTRDYCDKELGRCTNDPYNIDCDDNSECTVDICDPALDCLTHYNHHYCEDGFDCTTNVCDGSVGTGCVTTTHDALCDDGVMCTDDKCTTTEGCVFEPNNNHCADEHDCTENICDGEEGCYIIYHHDMCDDGVQCTDNVCTIGGCQYPPRDSWCNDDVGCTLDVCDPIGDCQHTAIHQRCDDNRNCSIETCDKTWGCLIEESNCPKDEDCEHCVTCKSGLSRLVVDDLEDGSGDLIIKTRNAAVPSFTVASPTRDLTENLKIKGSGAVIVGDVEHLDAEDGLVIAPNSAFKLVPLRDEVESEPCNDLNRGLIRVVEERKSETDARTVDRMYICLQTHLSYEWRLLNIGQPYETSP